MRFKPNGDRKSHFEGYANTRILVNPLPEWRPVQAKGLKYTVVFDGCATSRNALEVLASFTTEEEILSF